MCFKEKVKVLLEGSRIPIHNGLLEIPLYILVLAPTSSFVIAISQEVKEK